MSNSRTKTFEVKKVFKRTETLEGSKKTEPSRLRYDVASLNLKVGEEKL